MNVLSIARDSENQKIPVGSVILIIGLNRQDNQAYSDLLESLLLKNNLADNLQVASRPIAIKGASLRSQQWEIITRAMLNKQKEAQEKQCVLIERIDPDDMPSMNWSAREYADIILHVRSSHNAFVEQNCLGPRGFCINIQNC